MKKFKVGDRVVEDAAIAVAVARTTTEQDLRKTYLVTKVLNRPESEWTESIWLDDDSEPRPALYYEKQDH